MLNTEKSKDQQELIVLRLLILLLCLSGICIRLIPATQSLWYDELYSVAHAHIHDSFSKLFQKELIFETNPPLYQTFLYWWVKFGISEEWTRFPSAIFSIATILFVLLRGPQSIGKLHGWILAALLTASYSGLQLAREARCYSLLLLLSTILLFQIQKISIQRIPGSVRQFLLLFLVGILTCYTHHFGSILYFCSLFIAFVFHRPSRRGIVLTGLAVAACLTPWAVISFSNVQVSRVAWIPALSPWGAALELNEACFFNRTASVLWLTLTTTLAVWNRANAGVIWKKFRIPFFTFLLVCVVVESIHLFVPIIDSRYLIVMLPSLFLSLAIVIGEGLVHLNITRNQGVRYVAATAVFSLLVFTTYSSVAQVWKIRHADWRGVTRLGIELSKGRRMYCLHDAFLCYHYTHVLGVPKHKVTFLSRKTSMEAFDSFKRNHSIVLGVQNERQVKEVSGNLKAFNYEVKRFIKKKGTTGRSAGIVIVGPKDPPQNPLPTENPVSAVL